MRMVGWMIAAIHVFARMPLAGEGERLLQIRVEII